MIDLKDFEYDELIEYLTSVGEKKFRAEQIFRENAKHACVNERFSVKIYLARSHIEMARF